MLHVSSEAWSARPASLSRAVTPEALLAAAQRLLPTLVAGQPVNARALREAMPASDVTFLADNGIAYELVGEAGQPGVVLREFPLPAGRYNRERADILVLLPPGYPDACPDMFYAAPWICFPDGRSPLNADVEHVFAGRRWQRWSRHSQEWRPGIDGLRTMVARIRHALEVSK